MQHFVFEEVHINAKLLQTNRTFKTPGGFKSSYIAETLSISRNTVNKTVRQMLSTSLSFLEVEKLNDSELDKLFKNSNKSKREEDYVLPDYETLTKELARPGVTIQLLWEEYSNQCRLSKKKPYQLTQFKKIF